MDGGRCFSIGQYLEIAVAGSLSAGLRPRALISIQQDTAVTAPSVAGYAVWARVSVGRLRIMLGNVPALEALLKRRSGSDGFELEITNAAVVRRVADEIKCCAYRNDILDLFLQSKIIDLLIEGLSQPINSDISSPAVAARDMLLADPGAPPSMAELSRMVGLPPRKLSAQFRATFGKPIPEWLADWRLVRGRELVIDSDASIKNIALSLGYSHLPTFSAAFTRRFGVPPTNLRASRKLRQSA